MSKNTVSDWYDKAGKYKTKAIQESLKGNHNKSGHYSTLAIKYMNKAREIEKKEAQNENRSRKMDKNKRQ